jgi:uncharacterized protein
VQACLFDTNVWIAALFAAHPAHAVAQEALMRASADAPAVFCRATQQSFLRLATTPALLKVYGAPGMSNNDALVALDALQALPQTSLRLEAPGVFGLWRGLASADTASPKLWMDAYLAAFAIGGGLRLVSLDRDFNSFVARGLDLELLTVSA